MFGQREWRNRPDNLLCHAFMSVVAPALGLVLFILVPVLVWVGCFALADRTSEPLIKAVWRGVAFAFASIWFIAGIVAALLTLGFRT